MSKHHNCSLECCPRGFREHWQHSFYARWAYDQNWFGYWWYEFKSLIGLNNAKEEDEL